MTKLIKYFGGNFASYIAERQNGRWVDIASDNQECIMSSLSSINAQQTKVRARDLALYLQLAP